MGQGCHLSIVDSVRGLRHLTGSGPDSFSGLTQMGDDTQAKGGIPMKKHFFTAVAIAAFIAGAQTPVARSADKAPAEKAPARNGLTQDLMKVSDDGYSAIRAIHLARVAIFNGDTKIATEMLDKAKKDLDAATKDAQTFAADNKAADHGKKADDKSASDKMDLIPIDGEIAIADTFVPSDEKKRHIESANEHLKSGRSKEALEELRLGEVDVVFARLMLPLESTKKRVADAEKLANDHKWYEANLALKAAEGGLIIESVDLLGSPVASPAAPAAKVSKK